MGEQPDHLEWNIIANLRWLAEQDERPDRVPCGYLTGSFLNLVADRVQSLVDENNALNRADQS